MKILKVLKEQEETPNNLDVIDGGTYGFMKESLDKIQKILDDNSWRFSTETFNSPDGSYRCNTQLYVTRSTDTELKLAGKIYLMLKEPVIPLDFLSVSASWMLNKINELCPDVFETIKDGRYQEGSLTFNFHDIFIAYGETFLGLYDYMERAYYNTNVTNLIPIEELMNERSIDFNYKLEPSQVPTFSDDFSLATDRMMKKVKSVYRGFRKGTYKGHEYEFKEDNPRISIHLRDDDYNTQTKVIHPKFRVSLNAGYVWIDGKPTSEFGNDPQNRFTDTSIIKPIEEYLKARYLQFGIKFM
jgi:hypothetical protein